MKRFLLLIGTVFFISGSIFAQYNPGDIAIVRYNTDTNDGFSFVALVSIASGDSIFFTDEGWDDTAGSTGWRSSGEEHLKYISPGLSAGDVVHIEETSGDVFTVSGSGGTITLSRGTGFSLISGDQILAYIGSEVRPDSPTFLAALHGDDGAGTSTGSNDPNTKWTRDGEVAGTQQSTLPDRLINGVNAISVFGDVASELDNMIYNCTITSGTKAELLIAINNRSNWTTDDSNNQASSSVCSFSINADQSVVISGNTGWRLLSIPKTGATGADISDDGIGAQFTTNTDSATIYTYDNTGAYEAISSNASVLTDGFGLAVYFFDNTTNGSTTLPLTLDASGTEPSSAVTINLNKSTTSGGLNNYFTLSGNPFASNYDLNDLTTDTGTLQDNAHFWNDGTSSYETGDRTTNYVVSPWQGFWLEVANAGTATQATFPTSGKTTSSSSGTYFSKEVNNRGDIAFTLSTEKSIDKAIKLAVRDYASTGMDRADASKLVPLSPTYATMAFKSDEFLKSVESLPWNLIEEVKLDLEFTQVGIEGGFTFDWSGLESIPSDWALTFHDYKEGTTIDMSVESKYVFDASAPLTEKINPINILTGPAAITQKSKSAGTRFGITITPNTTSVNNEPDSKVTKFALDQNYPNPFNPTTTINYSVENSGAVSLSVYNLMGQKVAELVNETKSAGSYNVTWNASQAASGMYYYRLEADGQVLTRKMTLIK